MLVYQLLSVLHDNDNCVCTRKDQTFSVDNMEIRKIRKYKIKPIHNTLTPHIIVKDGP